MAITAQVPATSTPAMMRVSAVEVTTLSRVKNTANTLSGAEARLAHGTASCPVRPGSNERVCRYNGRCSDMK